MFYSLYIASYYSHFHKLISSYKHIEPSIGGNNVTSEYIPLVARTR